MLCMENNRGFSHTLRIRNTWRFSTATMVTRLRLSVTIVRTLPVFVISAGHKFSVSIVVEHSIDLHSLQ